jgi:uncharacterized DUF497 family protein
LKKPYFRAQDVCKNAVNPNVFNKPKNFVLYLDVVYTVLNEDTNDEIYWLISAREAEKWEIEDYEQEKFGY